MECGRSKARAWRFNTGFASMAARCLNCVKVEREGAKHAWCGLLVLVANAIQAARDVAGTAKA